MRVVMVTRDNAEYTREAMEWMAEFTRSTGIEVELQDPETIMGEIFATSHEIMQYPTGCVVDSSSRIISKWAGKLPQFEEVSYVLRDA